jgi:carboxymethylenebutenolidase
MSLTVTLEVREATSMNAYVATPQGNGPFPAVILFQEAFGVNEHIKDVAGRIAAEGYVVIAPELFHRTAPAGYTAAYDDFPAVMPHFQALTTEKLADDAQAAYDWLLKQDNVRKDRIGCIGFCLGGRTSFIANSVLPLAASVSFYGGGAHTVADKASTLHGPQLFFWGGKDQHIKPEHIQEVTDAVQAAGKDYINVVISYADHGFFCDKRPSYNADAAKEAWAMTLAFFSNKLKS